MTGPQDLYRYKATLIPWGDGNTSSWHDGDTCKVDVDQGMGSHWVGHLRTALDNAPEVNRAATKAAGDAATAFVRTLVEVGDTIYINSLAFAAADEKDDFGRMLGVVTLPDGRDLASVMIAAGHAVPDPA